jgi:hypothetical protein
VSVPEASARLVATVAPPDLDSREAIAAARLKHFEKKIHDTIDLTIDD